VCAGRVTGGGYRRAVYADYPCELCGAAGEHVDDVDDDLVYCLVFDRAGVWDLPGVEGRDAEPHRRAAVRVKAGAGPPGANFRGIGLFAGRNFWRRQLIGHD
jgi:hypothetical protein